MAARAGITHYAWPGGLAAVIEGPASGTAAVFGPGGWRMGPLHEVLSDGPPHGAEVVHLALPGPLVDQVATSLLLVGSGIHTDFVHLDRLIARLQADGTDAVLFVLGRAPAALVLSGGQVTVIEPRHEPVDEVLTGADGWIVVGLGKVSLPAPVPITEVTAPGRVHAVPAASPHKVAPVDPAPPEHQAVRAEPPIRSDEESAPPEPAPVPHEPEHVRVESVRAEPEGAEHARVPPGATADGVAAPPGAFGRFAPDARFVLAPGAPDRLPPGASTQIADAAGDAAPALMGLLNGAHTLSHIAAASGLAPGAVVAVVEILLAHRLLFRYVSRLRPPTGASTPG